MKLIAPTDPLSHSADLTVENIDRLRELFPQAVTEDGGGKRIDFDVLRELLGGELAIGEEKYGLNWHGKRAARRLALTPSTGTLRPAPEDSVDWDTTQNLMIEGDNLEVLKLLQKSYAGKVKMIYIDPPYNTGNDFVYKDDFKDSIGNYQRITGQRDAEGAKLTTNAESSGRFHTDWLNMMYPRLMLARTLLREEGAIFISIDDNEVDKLKLLCDDVFGQDNFIATVIWQKVFSPKNTAAHFSQDHDYVLVYARAKDIWQPYLLPRSQENIDRYDNPDKDPRGPWMSGALQARNFYSKGQYEVTSPTGSKFVNPRGTYWRFSKERFEQLDTDKRIWWGATGSGVPRFKRFLSEVKDGVVPQTLWKFESVGHTQEAKEELLKFVDFDDTENILNSVKPTRLIQQILKIGTGANEEAIVLDFFAGSGPSAHAVINQNVADGGNRRYILVQIPEPLPKPEPKARTIADFTKSRLRNVSKHLKDGAGSALSFEQKGSSDLGFRVFKLETTSIRPWDPTLPVTEQRLLGEVDNILPGRTEQDLLYELLLKRGLELTVPIVERAIADKQVYAVSTGDLIACLAPHIESADVEALAEGIVAWHKELAPPPAVDPNAPLEKPAKFDPPLVVFRDTAFADDVAKSNLTEILKQHNLTDVRSL